MLSSTLRAAFRQTGSARRHVSTKIVAKAPKPSSVEIPSHTTLPPAKMRALISLYHRAEDFITPENLSEEIDKAFIYQHHLMSVSTRREKAPADLKAELAERRKLPKMGEGKSVHRSVVKLSPKKEWSSQKDIREAKVMHTLFGSEDIGKPGLEILEEEEERIQAHIRRDREQQQRQ